MFKGIQVLAFSASIFLVACGGGSGGDEENQEAGLVCPSGSTFEINGIELRMDLYDRNRDGCLSEIEYEAATITANRVQAQQAKELVLDGENANSSISIIHSMKVIGSSEVSDSKAQLHTNIASGDFHISFTTYSTGSADERLKLYFDDESASGKGGTAPLYAMTFNLPPMVGDISYAFGCSYEANMSVNCDALVVTETDNIGSNVMTSDIDLTFPLSLTFAQQSLPQGGYIIGTFCDDSGDTPVCLDNYAEIPVSFN